VLGVSYDPPDANKAFRDKFGFPYDLLSDVEKSASVAYGAADEGAGKTSRVSVLIGPDGTIAASYATVKPADHPDEVLADLARPG
jgi:thioredoxin-dependent peroxiredoxin